LPERHMRILCGFKMYKALASGPWFNSVDAEEYRRLYMPEPGHEGMGCGWSHPKLATADFDTRSLRRSIETCPSSSALPGYRRQRATPQRRGAPGAVHRPQVGFDEVRD
jgi:hypothetical protein